MVVSDIMEIMRINELVAVASSSRASRCLAFAFLALGCASNQGKAPTSGGVESGLDAGADAAETTARPDRRICDGSTEIRFAFSYAATGAFALLDDLGSDFLYVDGTCHYWVQQPGSLQDEYRRWRSYREGVLTAAEEESLSVAVGYDDFSAAPSCSLVDGADIPVARMWDGNATHLCRGGLHVTGDWPMRAELFGSASDMAGALRVQVNKIPVTGDAFSYDWPLEEPLDEYLVEYGAAESFVIDDASSARALRDLRDRAIEDATDSPGYFAGGIVVGRAEGDEAYVLNLRDELPFADSEGMWSPD